MRLRSRSDLKLKRLYFGTGLRKESGGAQKGHEDISTENDENAICISECCAEGNGPFITFNARGRKKEKKGIPQLGEGRGRGSRH